jgi:phosphatidylserine/phosphatidylglycerophosphate/cardiolipin synthase-like enzyme
MAHDMTDKLTNLGDSDLRLIAAALRSGRLAPPFSTLALQRLVQSSVAACTAEGLQRLSGEGFQPSQMAIVLDLILKDREHRLPPEDLIDLVTTGPEAGTSANRDTGVVVRELFANANESVLVAGYAVYQGRRVFQALADRMLDRPEMKVQLFLDVRRGPGDTSRPDEVVKRFADHFRHHDWPQERPLPDLHYFPQSLEDSAEKRAALHAKCVIVDGRRVFVSSANFTEAAQERNIEVGVVVNSPIIAERLARHFKSLLNEGVLIKLL